MRARFCSMGAIVASLLTLLLIAGCGARETSQQAYPYPVASSLAVLPTAYPPPVDQHAEAVPQAEPTVIVDYAANVYGIVADAELRILHVEPSGGADLGGLRVGDILRSIAGVELRPGDPASLQEARAVAASKQPPPPQPGVPVPFVVERDGATLTLQVAPAPMTPRITPGQPPATATAVPPSSFYL